jgi:hypothetical protein
MVRRMTTTAPKPPTDWDLVREVMNAAIDACEHAERLGIAEDDRELSTTKPPVVSVFDVLTSAWTYPESVRYEIIRARHDLSDDAPYRLELARIIAAVGEACAELVAARRLDDPTPAGPTIRAKARALSAWYRDRFRTALTDAISMRAGGEVSP